MLDLYHFIWVVFLKGKRYLKFYWNHLQLGHPQIWGRKMDKALSYDDVLLVPSKSDFESRSEADISVRFGKLRLTLPILSAPMDTVTEASMASFMYKYGGLGIIHRYNSINQQFAEVKWVKEGNDRVAAAVGVNGDAKERADALVEAGVDMLVIDVAHGHSRVALDMISEIKNKYDDVLVTSGNVATSEGTRDSIYAGADIIRVGIGPGSSCTTRTVAGVGMPQFTAILNCVNIAGEIPILADGGIKCSGDIVKALAAGASSVIIGGMFASFFIAAGETYTKVVNEPSEVSNLFGTYQDGEETTLSKAIQVKKFRGMASDSALSERKRGKSYIIEGEEFEIPITYDYEEVMNKLRNGIFAGFSYIGARNIKELWQKAQFVEVSPAGYLEGLSHYGIVRK